MVRPDRESFRKLAKRHATVPIVREILADLDTPLASFLKLDDGKTGFLFESVEGGNRWGRYSIVGVGVRASLEARDGRVHIKRGGREQIIELPSDHSVDPLLHLRAMLSELKPAELPNLPKFAGGAVGFLSYDWVRYVERLPDHNPDPLRVPDAFFVLPELVLVHDRFGQRTTIIAFAEISQCDTVDAAYSAALHRIATAVERLSGPTPTRQPCSVEAERALDGLDEISDQSNLTRAEFHEIVKRAREYIEAGDIFQVVPSQRFTLPLRTDPLQIYRWLRVINPSPYLFFMRANHRVLLGSSPEILARLEDRTVTLRPIAGTRPRGATAEGDQRYEQDLLRDPKELAEHLMLVDLARNDVGRVAEIGSVRVDELQVIERYSHVMHIVSHVRGRLRNDCDAIDLLRASFPAGTLSGAPKVRAMEIIDELEPERRGLYGGCVGYIDYRGDMDACIAIRTLLIQGGKIYLQAGAGIVADSDPEREYQETLHKAGALVRAIQLASGGRT